MIKKLLKTISALGLISLGLNAQAQINCRTTASGNSNWPTSGCSKIVIDSFIPKPTDPVKHFKVSIHFFKKTSGVGAFDHATYNNCLEVVQNINANYHLVSPTLPTSPPQPLISDPRFDFTLANVFWHTDDNAFLSGFPWSNQFYFYQHYADPNSYNLFFVADPSSGASWTNNYNGVPFSTMNFGTAIWDSTNLGGGLNAHEMGHGLGALQHTDTVGLRCDGTPEPNPYNGNPYSPVDFYIEKTDCAHWGWLPCTPGVVGNNIMGQSECYTYLSPKQIACYHANYAVGNTALMAGGYDSTHNSIYVYNETWTQPKLITGDLIVQWSLTVQCQLKFLPGARLIVLPGARLILDGGTLTSIQGMYWPGVQVWGNSTANQSMSHGFANYQGLVSIVNGGTIQNAQTAISAIAAYNNNTLDWSKTGGIIQAIGANFLGNIKDVAFLYYQNATSASYFKGCTFSQIPLPTGAWGDDRVSLYGINGVKFYGNTFNGTNAALTSALRGNGITSVDAGYTLDDYVVGSTTTHNTFNTGGTSFNYNINAQNAAIFNTITVNNTVFGYPLKGSIYMNQMHYSIITNNTIAVKGAYSTLTVPDYAIYLDNCHGYSTRGNVITGYMVNSATHPHVGIIVNNGGTGANSVYNNTFNALNMGLWAQGQNQGSSGATGLIMNCNSFSGCTQDIGVVGPALPAGSTNGVLQVQGSTTNPALYVRNSYSTAGSGGSFNRYYTLNNNYQIKHPSYANTSTIYQPSPQQAYSDSNYVKILVESGTYSSSYCPANCLGCRTLPQVKQSIDQHKQNLLVLANGSNERKNLQDEINYEQNEAGNLANEKIRNFLHDTTLLNPIDSVIAVLKQKHNPNDYKMLVKAYTHKGDYASAQKYLDTLLNQDPLNQDFYDMHRQLITMHASPISYIHALKNNPGLKASLLQLANDRSKESCTQAQILLGLAFGLHFQEPIIMPENGNAGRTASDANAITITDESLKDVS